MNKLKIAYYITTALFSLMIAGGVGMYFLQHDQVATAYTALGYPTYLIYPLGTAKLLGLVAIWTRKSDFLKGLAYAGFFFNLMLAVSAHIAVGDGEFPAALVVLILMTSSYFLQRQAFASQASQR